MVILLDLKAFEQRLIECVSYTRNNTKKWKGAFFSFGSLLLFNLLVTALLVIVGLWVLVSIFIWWLDDTQYVSISWRNASKHWGCVQLNCSQRHKNFTCSHWRVLVKSQPVGPHFMLTQQWWQVMQPIYVFVLGKLLWANERQCKLHTKFGDFFAALPVWDPG